MSRIEWNKAGERFFEAGVDRGVLFPRQGPGVPWNGLISIAESTSGGDLESLYFEGVKYLDLASGEDFTAVLEAFAAPLEFGPCDGEKQLSPGLFVTQQPRQTFGLCYRTLIGNDLVGPDYGYKLHVVYNCTASPSGRTNQSLAETTNPDSRSWTINTVPPPATQFRPTAHLVIDNTKVDPYQMEQLEGLLYGHDNGIPYLPTIAQIIQTLDSRITPLITERI